MNQKTQEAMRNPSSINERQLTPRHIIKLQEKRDKIKS